MAITITQSSTFTKRLKEARKNKGISQKKLGIEAGIDEFSASARMNQYEKGKHTPDFKMSQKLAEILSVPTSYFYEEDDVLAKILQMYYSLSNIDKEGMLNKIEYLAKNDVVN